MPQSLGGAAWQLLLNDRLLRSWYFDTSTSTRPSDTLLFRLSKRCYAKNSILDLNRFSRG